MRDFKHALLASFVRPLAAASSLQALEPQSGAAFATEASTPPPRASTATPVSTFRAAMGRPPASAEAARAPDHPLTSTCGNAAAGNTSFGLRRGSLTPVLPLSREEKYRRGCGTDSPRRGGWTPDAPAPGGAGKQNACTDLKHVLRCKCKPEKVRD